MSEILINSSRCLSESGYVDKILLTARGYSLHSHVPPGESDLLRSLEVELNQMCEANDTTFRFFAGIERQRKYANVAMQSKHPSQMADWTKVVEAYLFDVTTSFHNYYYEIDGKETGKLSIYRHDDISNFIEQQKFREKAQDTKMVFQPLWHPTPPVTASVAHFSLDNPYFDTKQMEFIFVPNYGQTTMYVVKLQEPSQD